ncbi:MAG TPA: transketolase [Verrucomicrobia bacterium]|nr:transketolase [Verrucomicrobiota bacterium]
MTDQELQRKSIELRKTLLRVIFNAGAGHTGGGLSCLDILNVLYNRVLRVSPETFNDPHRDRYVQSKGHSVEALYVVLADRGFFPSSQLDTLCHYRSPFVGHPTRKIPGIEMNTGALGHGLSICVGMALAARMDAAPYRVFTLLGDGELAEGSNWEAAMAAAHYRLDNLIALIDHNTLQITGPTREVCCNEPLDEKWRAFGWTVRTVNGHDFAQLTTALQTPPEPGKPTCVIANTVKGKGVSFMEGVAKWHHGVPNKAELDQALAELDAALSVASVS